MLWWPYVYKAVSSAYMLTLQYLREMLGDHLDTPEIAMDLILLPAVLRFQHIVIQMIVH